MKPLLILLIALAVPAPRAQVPAAGPGAAVDGRGIRGVTYTNLTENTTTQARNFFIAGGIDLRPQPTPATVLPGPVFASAPQPVLTLAQSDPLLQRLLHTRDQLGQETTRLAGVIETRIQARQPWAAQARQRAALQQALQQTEQRIALRLALLQRASPTPRIRR